MRLRATRNNQPVMCYGHQQAIGFDQTVEDLLQNVLRITRIGHAPADEVQQARPLPLDHLGNALVLFECDALDFHELCARRFVHLRV